MGYLDLYKPREPTALEVYEAFTRLQDAMRYDWRREQAPERTVFIGADHLDVLRPAFSSVESTCVIVALGPGSSRWPFLLPAGAVFVFDAITGEPVWLAPEHVPELVRTIAAGEAPVPAAVRLAREAAHLEEDSGAA